MPHSGPERRVSVKHLRPPWQPGQSGNPLGVNRGVFALAAEIRRATGQGRKLVALYMAVAEGRLIPRPGGRAQRPTLEHQLQAAAWLADRGWGKAKELIELSGDSTTTAEQRLALLRRLSDEDRETLRGLLAKALATPDAPGPSDSRAAGDPEPHPADSTCRSARWRRTRACPCAPCGSSSSASRRRKPSRAIGSPARCSSAAASSTATWRSTARRGARRSCGPSGSWALTSLTYRRIHGEIIHSSRGGQPWRRPTRRRASR